MTPNKLGRKPNQLIAALALGGHPTTSVDLLGRSDGAGGGTVSEFVLTHSFIVDHGLAR